MTSEHYHFISITVRNPRTFLVKDVYKKKSLMTSYTRWFYFLLWFFIICLCLVFCVLYPRRCVLSPQPLRDLALLPSGFHYQDGGPRILRFRSRPSGTIPKTDLDGSTVGRRKITDVGRWSGRV